MKIKAILDIINSDRDRAGNCYWAFRYTDCKTGRQVCATTAGGESNIQAVFNFANWNRWGWDEIYSTSHHYGYREFCRITAAWRHAGCAPEDIADFIARGLKARKTA